VVLDIPRDRNGTFDPLLIGKYQRRFPEFDRKIISMYARGMTTREIQGHIEEIYGFEASPSLISAVTGAVMDEVTAWQNRPLEPCYPVVFMDAIRVNIRSDGAVSNKAVFVALAILPDGTRDVLGLWFQANEGAKFWAKVLNDLRNRGVQDILRCAGRLPSWTGSRAFLRPLRRPSPGRRSRPASCTSCVIP